MITRRELLSYSAAIAAAYAIPSWAAKEPATTLPVLSAHPRLLMGKAELAELKARIDSQDWAKSSWEMLKKNGDAKLGKIPTPADLPPRGGNWSHNYVCPTHGTRLRQGKSIGPWKWEHICPTGPHKLLGDPSKGTTDFDGNGIMGVHLDNADLLKDMGLLYQYTGDEKYGGYVRALLLAYADRYLTFALHDKSARLVSEDKASTSGRVACQPLTEASWLIGMAHGADFIWDTLSADEQKKAETKLFRPCLEQILLPSKLGIHNIQCRINSAIGLTGFLLGDQKLISIAIDNPTHGFRKQITDGIHADGMWLEGSSGYHFFAMEGLWPLAEAARINGLDLYSPKFKSMFDGPFDLARPDNVLPNFNDSGDTPLASQAALYELGLSRFKDPRYAAIIRSAANRPRERATEEGAEAADAAPRRNCMALLFGAYPLPDSTLGGHHSLNDTASGYAVLLRGNDASATWLCLKYGPHGGGHGHPDKNHFILYTRGAVLAPDVGSHAYGSPLHAGWDKTTLCHNTLVADEKSQAPAEGKSLAYGTEQNVDYSITDAGPIYEDINFIRTAALIDENLIVFVDQIVSEDTHTYDLAYHQQGEWQNLPAGTPFKNPQATGYNYLIKPTSRVVTDPLTLATTIKKTISSIIIAPALAQAETEIITGTGVLRSTEDLIPMLLMRRKADQTTYVWALSLNGAPVTLETVIVSDSSNRKVEAETAVAVRVTRDKRTLTLLTNPHKQTVTLDQTTTSAPFTVIA